MSATVLDAPGRLRRFLSAACLVVLAAAEIKAGDAAGSKGTVSKQKLYETALLSLKDKDHDGAIMLFEMCLKSLPDDADCHRGMGLALQEMKDFPAALTHFLRAVRMGPEDAQNHYHLGILRGKMRDWAASATAMEEAVRLKPNEPEYNYFLGAGLFQSGRKDEAGKHFKKACRLGWEEACQFLEEFPTAIESGAPGGASQADAILELSRRAAAVRAKFGKPEERIFVEKIIKGKDENTAVINGEVRRRDEEVLGTKIFWIEEGYVEFVDLTSPHLRRFRKVVAAAAPPSPGANAASSSDEELSVAGIMQASDGFSAIVNDKMVRVGDTVAGAAILKITADCVTYRRGGQTREACVK